MLADGVEAKIRADMPEDEAALGEAVAWVIEDRLASGQLARTDLTLKDLDTIRRSFVTTLRSIYHPRIRYPAEATDREPPPTPLAVNLPLDRSGIRPGSAEANQPLSTIPEPQER
jgi:hypothetical protein